MWYVVVSFVILNQVCCVLLYQLSRRVRDPKIKQYTKIILNAVVIILKCLFLFQLYNASN